MKLGVIPRMKHTNHHITTNSERDAVCYCTSTLHNPTTKLKQGFVSSSEAQAMCFGLCFTWRCTEAAVVKPCVQEVKDKRICKAALSLSLSLSLSLPLSGIWNLGRFYTNRIRFCIQR